MQIQSEPGQGPLAYHDVQTAVESVTGPVTPDGTESLQGHARILVVEDDPMVRRCVVMQLGDLGYTLREAAMADEALEVMEAEGRFDLLFTDIMMPGMTGRELAERALQRQPDLKVLLTSGYAEDEMTPDGCTQPGYPLLAKPYRRSELALAVRRALDGAAGVGT